MLGIIQEITRLCLDTQLPPGKSGVTPGTAAGGETEQPGAAVWRGAARWEMDFQEIILKLFFEFFKNYFQAIRNHLVMKLVQKSLRRVWKQHSGQTTHATAYDEFPSKKPQELRDQKGNSPL